MDLGGINFNDFELHSLFIRKCINEFNIGEYNLEKKGFLLN